MDPKKQTMNLQPIAILIDELKHEDVSIRINAIKRLSTIALALGFDRTREELLPFLQNSVDEEDEVLVVLAEELGKFVDFVGGPKFATILLGPLEHLAAVDEPLVRDKAVESITEISKVLSAQQCEESFLPIIKRLSSGDWFTRKISASHLIHVCYPKVSANSQRELRQAFSLLSQDESPLVRKAAATDLAKLIPSVDHSDILADLISQINAVAQDEQDSVRQLSIEVLIQTAQKLTSEENLQLIVQHLRNLWADKSWRIRYMFAERIVMVHKSQKGGILKEELNVAYSQLLKDNEAEVRNIACAQLPCYCELIATEETKKFVLPCLANLVSDSSQHVRASLANRICSLSPLLGKEVTMEYLLPLFLQLLTDDFHEVRLNIISKLDKVSAVIGIDLLSKSLLPAIIKLAEDKQLRVRLAIIEHIPLLARQFGADLFNETLISLCFDWLGDAVFAIREAATINLKNLIVVFGVDWAVTHVIPKILEMSKSENYLYRLTVIFAITTIASTFGHEIVKNSLMPIIKELANDPVPNVRFNVAKSLQLVTRIFNENNQTTVVNEQIRPLLIQLQQDEDQDVKYFATKAIDATNAMIS